MVDLWLINEHLFKVFVNEISGLRLISALMTSRGIIGLIESVYQSEL